MFDYGEVCPISKASSLLCERWTLQIIREMFLGASRFSEFQKYLPKLSPTLLNSRLKSLENHGLIYRKKITGKNSYEYFLKPAGKALKPLLVEFGKWGMNWAFDSMDEQQLNLSVIVRDFAQAINYEYFPEGDAVIQFNILEDDIIKKKYVFVRDAKSQVCDEDMGYEIDVYLTGSLKTFYELWFGECSVDAARKSDILKVVASDVYLHNLSRWLGTSQFATHKKEQRNEKSIQQFS